MLSGVVIRMFTVPVVLCGMLFGTVAWADLPDFTQLVEKNSPAVVKIRTETTKTATQNQQIIVPPGADVPDALRQFFNDPRLVAPPQQMQGLGSGFIVESDGYILTNSHVVANADKIIVQMNDRREFPAKLLGVDSRSDIALLKIDEKNLPTIAWGDSAHLKVGEWVLAIGSPFGFDYSASAGIVSAIGRSLPTERNDNYVPFIQTDVAINKGNSGGPLFNLQGQVIGVNSQIFSGNGGSIGISFAIPSSVARDVLAQLKEHGSVSRGWLGVMIQEVDRDLANSFGLDKPSGALIVQLVQDGPGENGGLLPGDIILKFNGTALVQSDELPHLVGAQPAGSTAELDVLREGKHKALEVVLGKLPDEKTAGDNGKSNSTVQAKQKVGRLGLAVAPLDPELARQQGVRGSGVLVERVLPDSPADRAGVQPGDVITQLGFTVIDSVEAYHQVVAKLPAGSQQPILFLHKGQPAFRSIRIE